jgi:N-dimethylarginine dimethylaminohydrolase
VDAPEKPSDAGSALVQWERLRDLYRELGHTVELIEPIPGLPDMVFAANGATTVDGKVLAARLWHMERTAEGPAHMEWFRAQGYTDVRWPKFINEGEGDYLLAGTGFRTDLRSHFEAQEFFGVPVTGLTLVARASTTSTPRSRCCPTRRSCTSPGAFSAGSQAVLRELYPDAILAAEEDAEVFGLNAFSDGRHVLLPSAAMHLADKLRKRGFEPTGIDLPELLKAGGGTKCCTLELRG